MVRQTHQFNLDFETFDGETEIVITDFSAVRPCHTRSDLPYYSWDSYGKDGPKGMDRDTRAWTARCCFLSDYKGC